MNNEIFPLQHPATNTCAQASLVSCCLKVFLFLGILIGFIIPCAIGNESVQKPAEGNASGTGEIVSFSVPIKEKRVYVYAGPGENFYPTTILEQGDIVEVFTRNANGWCAIRPPNGSFSWVNKRFVRIDQDNIGIIVCENHGQTVPVRVGADSIMESSVIQIGLENGKKVRIKGETRLPGGTVWCKVSPPAGEFRYIHENFLEEVETIQQVPDRLMLKREYLEAVMGDIIESPTPAPVSPLPLALPSMPGIAGVPFASSDQSSKTIFQQPPVLQVPDFTDDAGKMPTFPVTPSTTIAERVRDNVGRPQTPSTLGNPLAPLSGPNYKFPVWDPQSFDDNFSLEVARLNRDLFAVVSRGGTDEVYNLLSERAITLFDIAGTDDQRTVVQTLHHKINRFRYGDTGTEMIPAQAVPAQKMNESAAAIVLNPPPHRGEAEVKKSPDHLRFAFAAENSPLKPGRGRTPVQVASLPQAVPPKA